MLLAMVDDIRVVLVKLADRLHNMRTLAAMPDDRRQRTAQETLDIYAPIANRLGMSRLKNELEDLAFQYLEPEVYEALQGPGRAAAQGHRGPDRRPEAGDGGPSWRRRRSRSSEIDGRIKRLYSIHLKLQAAEDRPRAGLRLPGDPDHHAHASRTATPRSAIIHHAWPPVPGPHQGLHRHAAPQRLPVAPHVGDDRARACRSRCRSAPRRCTGRRRRASPSHWKYKEGRVGAANDERYFQWLRQMLEWQQEVRDPQEFIQNLKVDLYPDEVYTFTPKGQVKSLPRDATVIDFAYAIHTDVGHQCVGARINGKMMPLRTRLKNGDIVEIVTNAEAQAQPRLAELRRHDAGAQPDQAVPPRGGEGAARSSWARKLLEKEARRFDVNVKTLFESDLLDRLAPEWGVPDGVDLLAAVGVRQGRRAPGAHEGRAGRAVARRSRSRPSRRP